ncbi:NAD-dependent epimerase/dehydratase family protein [Chryseobacterium arthrosphaerae]|uniref:NAD-dependent epimerase/dehydratase family protein n=1 Tax=Chryseobacterium arthrosphaerae TaxID=651561 RepID=UPI001F4B5FC1|nr:NAD-dependent epimerase/dehydratase family protein [Chryseobacterium arthrosphaerae]MDG4654626.1 NAD-dependent epimerase/dehydratase family protein [Chryseobacterium arthrosphaerae]
MIIGNGILANAIRFYDREDVIFFASGVSNSLEKNPAEFEREISLLKSVMNQHPDKKLIYFSTCSIYDASKTASPYVMHKLTIEKIIAEQHSNFIIFRVGNAVGRGGNPNTLINFLKSSILSENKLTIHNNARRILIGTDDIASFVGKYINDFNDEIINLAYPYQYSLPEILSTLEDHLGKKANYESVDEGSFYNIEFNNLTEDFFTDLSPDEYLKKLYSSYL